MLIQAIAEILDSDDLSSITASILRSKLENKFQLNQDSLKAHRDTISSLMNKHIDANLKQTDMDDLDKYLEENIDNNNDSDSDIDPNHNNRKRSKKSKSNKKSHSNKNKNKKKNEIGIMDIDYSDPSNSRFYDIFTDENNIKYSIMLNQTDINYGVRGHNKFYAIQLFEHKNRGLYKFVVKWGRVGARAQTTEDMLDSKIMAIEKFKKKFKDKTKNEFGTKHFKAVKGKYVPIAIATNDSDDESTLQSDDDMKLSQNEDDNDNDDETQEIIPSELNSSLVRILKLIFSKQLQQDTAKEFDYDLNSPLGQLRASQINKGYGVLCKINDILVTQRNNNNKLGGLTNKYYTIIPHDFGHKLPPIINTLKRLHREIELIETLKQMIFTNKILAKRNKKKNPIDVHYNALHCDIMPISHYCKEYEMITKSIKQTHAATHNRYKMEILDIFECDRINSKFRHLPFTKLKNKQLLWHGSRLSNFVGILSQGLRIAPPEAPSTGYMFGKGIYFADCASKSANYIHATEDHPFGLLILCEVALGNIYEIMKAKYMDKPPNGYHSVKGKGKNILKQEYNVDTEEQVKFDINGYELGLGPLVKNQDENVMTNGNLLYNEYIVYDVGQVRMKYLVLVKFNFDNDNLMRD